MVFRIFKIIATSGFLAAVECMPTKFVFGRGSTPEPTVGAYSAPHADSLSVLRGTNFKGEGKKMDREKGGEGERKGREGKDQPPFANAWIRPC